MPSETIEQHQATERHHRATFFRQSGWMLVATVIAGVFTFLVHALSKKLPPSEYSIMTVLFQLLNWMTIPALGLQMVFAQQTSAVVTENQKRQLIGTVRAVLRWTFYIWLVMAVVAVVWRNWIIGALTLSNPMALWLTVVVALVMLWLPIFQGLLQGRQNFLWLGWVNIFNGVGRLVIATLVVVCLGGYAAGVMGAVLIGLVASAGTAAWNNRDWRHEPSAAFDARGWLQRVAPLTLGYGASQFLFSTDAIVVAHYFGMVPEMATATAAYLFCGTLARAIVLFTQPLAAVMFPKLVHSAARSQKSNLMGITLAGTAVLGGVAAVGLTVTVPVLIKYVSNPAFALIVPLMPWFAWSMVPLAVGNVLLNNLMAHSRFKVVPVLVLVAAGYWVALQYFHDNFKMVIETLGVFNLLMLAACAVFTWWVDGGRAAVIEPENVG